ncbi:MAG: DNA-processing protein DprA [Thermoguttaceae bacterium]|nr:DNA-processing protein DprA [Thermoguttaceae bacterium]
MFHEDASATSRTAQNPPDRGLDSSAASRWTTNGENLRFIQPEEFVDEIALATVEGIGPITAERLVARFGSATEVLNAPAEELERVERVGASLAKKIRDLRSTFDPAYLIKFCDQHGIRILFRDDARYPSRLREIDNPPRILYVRGKLQPRDRAAIAMVGTRSATPYGSKLATRLARELVEAGFTVVSGLALGIDGNSHRGALDAGGRTLAVLGGGVVDVYPREHEDLAARIIQSGGALISEYYPLTKPLRGNFPARNRIISGLSLGVIVVESALKGGSLITASCASEQNREVFAAPGSVDSPFSAGCHQLLREGATLVESVEDVIAALPEFELPQGAITARSEKTGVVPGTLGVTESAIASIDTRSKSKEKGSEKRSKKKKKGDKTEVSNATDSGSSSASKPTEPKKFARPTDLSPEENALLDAIGSERILVDELVRATGFSTSKAIGLVSLLEFKKAIRRVEGNAVERVEVDE